MENVAMLDCCQSWRLNVEILSCEKGTYIAIASMQNIDMPTHRRLIPLLGDDAGFRMAINAKFIKKPPREGWLGKYYKVLEPDPIRNGRPDSQKCFVKQVAFTLPNAHSQSFVSGACDRYGKCAVSTGSNGSPTCWFGCSPAIRSIRWEALRFLIQSMAQKISRWSMLFATQSIWMANWIRYIDARRSERFEFDSSTMVFVDCLGPNIGKSLSIIGSPNVETVAEQCCWDEIHRPSG